MSLSANTPEINFFWVGFLSILFSWFAKVDQKSMARMQDDSSFVFLKNGSTNEESHSTYFVSR